MTGKEKPWKQGGNQGYSVLAFDKGVVSALTCVLSPNTAKIISPVSLIVQVGLFRAGKKTSRQSKFSPPIADRVPGLGRINTAIIPACIPGIVLQFSNLCDKSLVRAGVNYAL